MNYKVSSKGFGRNRSHKAVAPIIATLLMVAIAVVGGVMVYIFTQGFFGSTTSTAPTVDAMASTGYDFREIEFITRDDGTNSLLGQTGAAGGIGTGEYGALYVKNARTSALTITKMTVGGTAFAFSPSGPAADTEFQLWKVTGLTGEVRSTTPTINAGETGTLLLKFSNADGALNGRTLAVKVSSGNGGVFNFQVVVGTKV